MLTQLTEWKPTPLALDIIQNSGAVLANAAHQSLVLELIQVYELSLKHISDQTQIDFHCLSSLAAGTLNSLTLSDYMKLLCFYCYQQAQQCSPDAKTACFPDLVRDASRLSGLRSVDKPLSIYAKCKPIKRIQEKRISRYYLNDTLYLTQREYEIARLLLDDKRTYKTMGKQLSLSVRTIEYYVANLRTKFNAKSRLELKEKIKLILQ